MRVAAAGLKLLENPHPTRLRRATLSQLGQGKAAHRSINTPSASDPELAASETSIARSSRSIAIQAISAPSTTTTAASSVSTDGQ